MCEFEFPCATKILCHHVPGIETHIALKYMGFIIQIHCFFCFIFFLFQFFLITSLFHFITMFSISTFTCHCMFEYRNVVCENGFIFVCVYVYIYMHVYTVITVHDIRIGFIYDCMSYVSYEYIGVALISI